MESGRENTYSTYLLPEQIDTSVRLLVFVSAVAFFQIENSLNGGEVGAESDDKNSNPDEAEKTSGDEQGLGCKGQRQVRRLTVSWMH